MRADGRSPEQLRRYTIEPGFIRASLGSALISAGRTRVICTANLEAKPPGWLKSGGWVTAEYSMLPGATRPRGRRDPGGRGKEIQRLIGRSLRAAVNLSALVDDAQAQPLSLIIDCDVIEADGGTRTASITGGYVALALAVASLRRQGRLQRSPLSGAVAAVSVGLVALGADAPPSPVLDLPYEEDSRAHADVNIVMRAGGGLIEVQGTAENGTFDRAELSRMLDLATAGCNQLFALQSDAIERGLASASGDAP
ncbi:MAG: ribonuclease PH [Myxococcales bacterium]|nr:ribonuclease PH [Myxococcales bacterium]MCB9752573.1 ribonuclease PH [Myxococcales bacterium]